jgi:hypothetical protein
MEEIKQKVEDLELELNYVCYDADLIPKLQTVWQKLDSLLEVVNKKCNIPHVMPAVCVGCITAKCRNEWVEPCHSCSNGNNKQTEA